MITEIPLRPIEPNSEFGGDGKDKVLVADSVDLCFFLELARTATRSRPFNVAVTNVPGPPMTLYLNGARLRAIYPMMPLFSNQALGVAVMSYAGRVFWGWITGPARRLPPLQMSKVRADRATCPARAPSSRCCCSPHSPGDSARRSPGS